MCYPVGKWNNSQVHFNLSGFESAQHFEWGKRIYFKSIPLGYLFCETFYFILAQKSGWKFHKPVTLLRFKNISNEVTFNCRQKNSQYNRSTYIKLWVFQLINKIKLNYFLFRWIFTSSVEFFVQINIYSQVMII